MTATAYDSVLLVSFGGPEHPTDVEPFLANVTAGRMIPAERLAAVAQQYHHFGGVSPLNAQCRRLRAALADRLAAAGRGLPVYWGNRNWAPYLADTVAEMAAAGHRRALAVVTSAYSSYSGCRQYLEDIAAARAALGGAAPAIDKVTRLLRPPGFRGALRRRGRRGPREPSRRGQIGGWARVHSPLHPADHGRGLRLRAPVARGRPPSGRRCRLRGLDHGLAEPQRPAPRCCGWSPT